MIANPPPIAIRVNGHPVGALGVRWLESNPKRRASSVPEQHQRKIAAQTLRMSDVFARIMGGMTKEEARRVLRRNPSAAAMSKVLSRYGLQSVRHKGEARQLYRQLGQIARARGVPRRSFRRNPSSARRPGEVEIYADIERVYATKGRRSTASGERFVHNFRHAAAFGRPDGTVVLRGRGGRRLWDHFRA